MNNMAKEIIREAAKDPANPVNPRPNKNKKRLKSL